MDKKEEKIDQEELLEQQVNRRHNVWLVTFFVLLSSLSIFGFYYLSKFSSDRINIFLSRSTKSENEIIDEKFSDYWERLKKIVELIFIILSLIVAYRTLKNKIFKSVDDKDVKKIRDGFLNFQKNIIYDYYVQSGYFDFFKRKTAKQIANYASLISAEAKEIDQLKRNALEKKDFLNSDRDVVISKKQQNISLFKETIIKLSYLLNKIFSKETIFEIIGIFLNSQSVTVNPFCEYNVYIRDNAGESLNEINEYYKKCIFSKVNGNGEQVLPVFEDNSKHIFFECYLNEDNNELLKDVEEVIKRAKEVVIFYEKLEVSGSEVNKISKIAKDKHNHNEFDDKPNESNEDKNKKYSDHDLLKELGDVKKNKEFQESRISINYESNMNPNREEMNSISSLNENK